MGQWEAGNVINVWKCLKQPIHGMSNFQWQSRPLNLTELRFSHRRHESEAGHGPSWQLATRTAEGCSTAALELASRFPGFKSKVKRNMAGPRSGYVLWVMEVRPVSHHLEPLETAGNLTLLLSKEPAGLRSPKSKTSAHSINNHYQELGFVCACLLWRVCLKTENYHELPQLWTSHTNIYIYIYIVYCIYTYHGSLMGNILKILWVWGHHQTKLSYITIGSIAHGGCLAYSTLTGRWRNIRYLGA